MIVWSKVAFVGLSHLKKGIEEYCEKLPEEIQSHIEAVIVTENEQDGIFVFSIVLSLDYGDKLECPFLESEKVTKITFSKKEVYVDCATEHKYNGKNISISYIVKYN